MTPPTPAAVRFSMCNWDDKRKPTPEEIAAYQEEFRTSSEILADHIRAVCAEMREKADMHGELDEVGYYTSLRRFANKLEGREP